MTTTADPVRQIARAVLYEGYLLWPYRRSALKNQRRWTFGCVYPQPYCAQRGAGDPHQLRTECLLEVTPETTVDVQVRFLQVVQRDVVRLRDGRREPVAELTVDGQRHLSWEEATEREVTAAAALPVDRLLRTAYQVELDLPAGERTEWLTGHCGRRDGALVRHWDAMSARLAVAAEPVQPGVVRVRVEVTNTTDWHGEDRQQALRRTLVSTHTVARTGAGRFVSLLDPPERLAEAAAACRNTGTWPVLVGHYGDRGTLLSSPIILYDYPRVSPESPGDLFDATEIDELLTLSVRGLSEAEQREIQATDPHAREILDRCSSLSPAQLLALHGTMREVPRGAQP